MQQIYVDDRPAAAVLADRFFLVQDIEQLPEDDPQRRWVTALCFYAMRQLELGEPYEADVGAFVARGLLMPEDQFVPKSAWPDSELAAHFAVPLAQVELRRVDLALDA